MEQGAYVGDSDILRMFEPHRGRREIILLVDTKPNIYEVSHGSTQPPKDQDDDMDQEKIIISDGEASDTDSSIDATTEQVEYPSFFITRQIKETMRREVDEPTPGSQSRRINQKEVCHMQTTRPQQTYMSSSLPKSKRKK